MPKQEEEITTRLKTIFDCFLSENFVTTNNVYFEKLTTHLMAKENEFITQESITIEFIDRCLTLITEDYNRVNPKVISFMFNFAGHVSTNEWTLIKLKEHAILSRAFTLMERDEEKFTPSIKLSCINLLSSVTKYSLGLGYIKQARIWAMLIRYSNHDHTVYVVREARRLLYELLYKFSAKLKDDEIVLEILAEILKPIHENMYIICEEQININVDDKEVLRKMAPSLDLLSYILQQTLESEEKTNIIHLLKVHHSIEMTVWKLTDMAHNPYFAFKIMTTLTSLNFANLVYEKLFNVEDTTADAENFNEFGLSFFNMMKFCVQRTDGLTFIKMAELNHFLWKKLGTRAPKEIVIEHQRVAFENQLICFHMMPLFFAMKSSDELRGEIFDNYIMKLFEISSEQTLRICYGLRDAFSTTDGKLSEKFTPDLAHKCIHSILSLERVLDREHAVLVCQALLYVLKEIVMLSNTSGTSECPNANNANYHNLFPIGSEVVLLDPRVLHSVMVGLQKLIEVFKITWKESVETIGLVNCVAFVLENRNLDARCTVQALKLVQLAVEHFLSPNMALLVDNLQGSGLLCLGPIIAKRLHDVAWEVRDTALELTTSIACISHIKFPAFQRFLIDFKIPPIVYQMVKHDSEPYVRASAFKCLTNMVSINVIWENELSQVDLIDHLLYVLYNESEDIVRTEAIATLCVVYQKRKIPLKYKNVLFSTLNYCIVSEHHCEVKINALGFWRMEFNRQLTNQGMIDGIFPTVTFSKEHKKIVTLTEREIKLRISKVLAEMQQYGYFGILIKCLQDEYALEVLKFVTCSINKFFEKLHKDFDVILADIDVLVPTDSGCSSSVTTPKAMSPPPTFDTEINNEQADAVIDDILDAQDIKLLEHAFDTQMDLNSCTMTQETRHIDEYFYKQYAMSVREFITTVEKYDLNKLANQHKEWLERSESFVSLLDDLLFAIRRDDENMVSDCY